MADDNEAAWFGPLNGQKWAGGRKIHERGRRFKIGDGLWNIYDNSCRDQNKDGGQSTSKRGGQVQRVPWELHRTVSFSFDFTLARWDQSSNVFLISSVMSEFRGWEKIFPLEASWVKQNLWILSREPNKEWLNNECLTGWTFLRQ